ALFGYLIGPFSLPPMGATSMVKTVSEIRPARNRPELIATTVQRVDNNWPLTRAGRDFPSKETAGRFSFPAGRGWAPRGGCGRRRANRRRGLGRERRGEHAPARTKRPTSWDSVQDESPQMAAAGERSQVRNRHEEPRECRARPGP